MIKERFLEPFKKMVGDSVSDPITKKYIGFLRSAKDEELRKIGWSIFYIFPKDIGDQIIPFFNKKGEYDFIADYVRTYNLSDKMTSKDKAQGSKLVKMLELFPDMTASDFLKQ